MFLLYYVLTVGAVDDNKTHISSEKDIVNPIMLAGPFILAERLEISSQAFSTKIMDLLKDNRL